MSDTYTLMTPRELGRYAACHDGERAAPFTVNHPGVPAAYANAEWLAGYDAVIEERAYADALEHMLQLDPSPTERVRG